MRTYADGFLDSDDSIEIRPGANAECIQLGGIRIFTDLSGLARIGVAIERRLRDALNASMPPCPAEAATGVTVDADDLFAAMACTYDVRRGAWDGEEVAL